MTTGSKKHWEKVYASKQPHEVSWTQEIPQISLDIIHSFKLDKTAAIIDIGGGDSKLVDHLLNEGFENITVLDISKKALARARKRLGSRSKKVKWIVTDVTKFQPVESYDVWHDRATFHFLVRMNDIEKYLRAAEVAVKKYLIMGSFSDKGPKKCSGLEIKQYTETQLQDRLSHRFRKIKCITEDHITPFNTHQHFLFCSFRKNKP